MLSRAAWEEFAKTGYWEDIKEELTRVIARRREELEDPDIQLTLDNIRQLQGAIKAYREICDFLPEMMIALASEERT